MFAYHFQTFHCYTLRFTFVMELIFFIEILDSEWSKITESGSRK